MTHRTIDLARWRAILSQQSPLQDGLLHLWTATFLPESFDDAMVRELEEVHAANPAPDLEYALALLRPGKTVLKAPPFHAHLAFLVHRIGFNGRMMDALSRKPSATAVLLYALSQGDAGEKLKWLQKWQTAIAPKSARGVILRALVAGAPISNPFQSLHMQALSQAWLLASSALSGQGGADGPEVSTETVWKRMQAHPVTKAWIRLKVPGGQAAPLVTPTIQ